MFTSTNNVFGKTKPTARCAIKIAKFQPSQTKLEYRMSRYNNFEHYCEKIFLVKMMKINKVIK